jgi:stage II sporulation protein AA (anti-sigma F factor antagonist)
VIKFSLSSKSELDVAVMRPRGYFTEMGAHRIEKASKQFLERGYKKIIINFSDVELINTHGISIFKNILQKTSERGGCVCFTNINDFHREIFDITGLLKHVAVFEDEDEAKIFLKKMA